jgi:putative ABC transport system permease protein
MATDARRAWEIAFNDVRYAWRRLIRAPAFTIVAALSLAIGIGANTAAFGVLYAVLLRPLPVADPASLAVVSLGRQFSMSYPSYEYLRDYSKSLDGLVAFRAIDVKLANGGGSGATERAAGMLVSGNYFSVLGVEMAIGSPIREDDDRTPESGGARGLVAVLSHQVWMQRFNGDPAIAGKPIRVNGELFTVIGVTPASFRGTRVGSFPDVFVPMAFARPLTNMPNALTAGTNHWIRLIARIKRGVGAAQAQAEMDAVFQRFTRERLLPTLTTEASRRRTLGRAIRLRSGSAGLLEMGDTIRPTLYLSMGLMGLVLLIACVNVANLMVARAERYRRDTAIHVALGASGGRLWSQTLAETFMLGGLGVASGLVLAAVMRGPLARLLPADQQIDLRMDAEVLGASVLAGFAAALFLAIVTAWQGAWQSNRRGVIGALKDDQPSARLWLRKGLIAGQLALSVVVLVAAALLGQTLRNLHLVEPGFERSGVLIASVDPGGKKPDAQAAFYQALLEEVRAIPGVASASLAGQTPLDVNTWWGLRVHRDASVVSEKPGEVTDVPIAFVAPGYFATMGIPFVRGRDLDVQEEGAASATVVVNQAFATRLLGREDVVGATVSGNGKMVFTIAGVVRDSAALGLRETREPVMYVPLGRTPRGQHALHIRSAVPPATLTTAIEAMVRRIASDVPIYDVHAIDQEIDRDMGRERTFAQLTSVFGVLALLLCGVGLYGLMAYAVSRRMKELGIRIALGAAPPLIVRLVLREAVLMVAIGLALGISLASALAGTLEGVLFGVQPGDWRSVASAVAVLLMVAMLSAWLPARRAATVDPLIALRHD